MALDWSKEQLLQKGDYASSVLARCIEEYLSLHSDVPFPENSRFMHPHFTLDRESRRFASGSYSTILPPHEFDLLSRLIDCKDKFVGTDVLLQQVWGDGYDAGNLTAYIYRLREHLQVGLISQGVSEEEAHSIAFKTIVTSRKRRMQDACYMLKFNFAE